MAISFGRAFTQQAANPAFTEGLFALGQQLGSAPRRQREEAELRTAQEGMFSAMQKAQIAQQEGNLTEIDQISSELTDLMKQTNNTALKEKLGENILLIGDMRTQAIPRATLNKARTLNKAQNSLPALEDQLKSLNEGDMTEENMLAINTLSAQIASAKDTINKLSNNPDVASKAASLQFETTYNAINNEVKLLQAQEEAAYQKLSRIPDLDSEQAKGILKQPGAGNALRRVREERAALVTAEAEAQAILDGKGKLKNGELDAYFELNPKSPMTRDQLESLEPELARKLMAINLTETAKAQAEVNANEIRPTKGQALTLAKAVLAHVDQTGDFEDNPLNFFDRFQDIDDKIDDMSKEELDEFLSGFEGDMSVEQIVQTALDKLKNLFPRQMEEYNQQFNIASVQEAVSGDLFEILRDDPRNAEFSDQDLRDIISARINPDRAPTNP